MAEKDFHTEKEVHNDADEDTEAHVHHAVDLGENVGENLRQDEGDEDDVEAHQNLNAVDLGENLGENLG